MSYKYKVYIKSIPFIYLDTKIMCSTSCVTHTQSPEYGAKQHSFGLCAPESGDLVLLNDIDIFAPHFFSRFVSFYFVLVYNLSPMLGFIIVLIFCALYRNLFLNGPMQLGMFACVLFPHFNIRQYQSMELEWTTRNSSKDIDLVVALSSVLGESGRGGKARAPHLSLVWLLPGSSIDPWDEV